MQSVQVWLYTVVMTTHVPAYLPTPTDPPSEYAPTTHWGNDILGPGFFCRTFPLGSDDEGELVTTLIKYDPQADPQAIKPQPEAQSFVLLYIHGWNDYYFQRETARHTAAAGGVFYAMDLEKFGRSFRPWQTFGGISDLVEYDRDFAAAFAEIESAHPQLPIVLMGHSMGGLITTYWVGRHPGRTAGLILNSPWLSHLSDSVTSVAARMRDLVHGYIPERWAKAALPMRESDIYDISLGRWPEKKLPAALQEWRNDPSIAGWNIIDYWKYPLGRHTRLGWMGAIFKGHNAIASGLRVDVPVLLTLSTSSPATTTWNPLMHFQDVVLNVKAIMRHGPHLSKSVTIERFPGIHDLVLSVPPVRKQFWSSFHDWLHTQGFETAQTYQDLGERGRKTIRP